LLNRDLIADIPPLRASPIVLIVRTAGSINHKSTSFRKENAIRKAPTTPSIQSSK